MQTGRMQRQAVDLGTEAAQALLRASLPRGVFWSFGIPSQSALMSFIGSLEEGSPLRKLFRGFGLKAARLVEQTLIGGLTLGWNPRRIAPMVQQALNVTRQRATLIARTEYIRAYRGSNLANYRAYKDVCGQWRWTTAKQKRSCMACIMMDGTLHSLDEEMGSHPGCRCAPIPLTKDWSDILGVDSVRDTRPSIQSGKDWFLKQSQATQREMLGDARYNAWQEGQFELSDVVKKTHDEQWGTSVQEKSLKELVK
jgi:SPP1 gp7 family putative phage head morphogenesis protein